MQSLKDSTTHPRLTQTFINGPGALGVIPHHSHGLLKLLKISCAPQQTNK